jgi:hypothetical protein
MLGGPRIRSGTLDCLTTYFDYVTKCRLPDPVDDVPNVLELTAFDASELNVVRAMPNASGSSGAYSPEKVDPPILGEVRVELDDEGGCFHDRLTLELSGGEAVRLE